MSVLEQLMLGLGVAVQPVNLLYCFVGTLMGTLIGVLPGIGPVATIAMLLPVTFGLPPAASLIMLAGIYYGAQYGGSTTAILINLPGETSSVITCLDGYQMARRGRAGAALAIAALASFFAGCVATLVVALFAPALADVALRFGQAEYFSLMILGLVAAAVLARGSLLKAVGMIVLGLLIGLIGVDPNSGIQRFAFGVPGLADGIGFVTVAMGLFGIAEVIANLQRPQERSVITTRIGRLLPSGSDIATAWKPVLRGTGLGSALGILPGGGPVLASYTAYTLEKRLAADPSRFGEGAIEGVAAPEAANNAAAQTSFIPMLTLGIPSNPTMALMIGALMIQGISPGPQVATERPELFWGVIASMWVGNLMLVLLNLPLIGIWIRLLSIPYRFLYPAILLFCAIGVYSIANSTFDVALAAAFGCLGYIFLRLDCEPAPLILGFILGPMMEEALRRALVLSRGDPSVFVTRPLSLGLLLAAGALILVVVAPSVRRQRATVFQEQS